MAANGEASKLLELINDSMAVVFYDQYDDAYIAFNGDGSKVCKVSSKTCKQWIMRLGHIENEKGPASSVINQVVQMLEGQALFEGEQHELDVRLFKNEDGSLLYDLGSGSVQVDKSGWAVLEKPPIVFKRLSHQKPQVVPKRGGNLKQLLKYINLDNEPEQILFLTFVVTAFIPGFAHPILILHGTQGAGKSTPMKIVKELVDPSALNSGLPHPDSLANFGQTANHNAFLYYDNLSLVADWFSDALARAATGSSFSKRQLFTDDEDVIYSFQRTIALNGINQVVSRSDLLDRSILLQLERITPDKRKEFNTFWADFEKDRPYILGAIFETIAKSMEAYPTVKVSSWPRMADFAHWGYAIAEVAGYGGAKFLKAYSDNIKQQHDHAIAASPLAQTIVEFMRERTKWSGEPAELYGLLHDIAVKLQLDRNSLWPRDAANMGKALNQLIPNLVGKGIEVERRRGDQRIITLYHKTTDTTDGTDGKKG